MGIYFNPDLAAKVEVPNVEAVLLLQRQILAASQLSYDHDAAPQRLALALASSMNVQTPVTLSFSR